MHGRGCSLFTAAGAHVGNHPVERVRHVGRQINRARPITTVNPSGMCEPAVTEPEPARSNNSVVRRRVSGGQGVAGMQHQLARENI